MRAPAQRPGDSAGCAGGSGSNLYTGSRHQDRTDLRADAALHYRPVSSGAGQTLPGGQLILTGADQNPWAHLRSPMDMMIQGWSMSLGRDRTALHHPGERLALVLAQLGTVARRRAV